MSIVRMVAVEDPDAELILVAATGVTTLLVQLLDRTYPPGSPDTSANPDPTTATVRGAAEIGRTAASTDVIITRCSVPTWKYGDVGDNRAHSGNTPPMDDDAAFSVTVTDEPEPVFLASLTPLIPLGASEEGDEHDTEATTTADKSLLKSGKEEPKSVTV